jgi:hypothetical protein
MKTIGALLTFAFLGLALAGCASNDYDERSYSGGGQTNPFHQGHGGSR